MIASLAAAPSASAVTFTQPTFIRQWDPGPLLTGNFENARAVTVDPFGNVYVLRSTGSAGAGSFLIQKYQDDGTPIPGPFDDPQTGLPVGGLATDPVGHVFVTVAGGPGGANLREFTSGGGELGELNAPQLLGTTIAFDAAGHLYGAGYDAAHNPALNEYTIAGATVQLVASTPYPGSPNTGFFPYNFFGLTIDETGNVYASGTSTTESFIIKYSPGLSSLSGYMERCPLAENCFGGFSLAFTHTGFPSGTVPTVYAGGGHSSASPAEDFYRMGVYGTEADVPSGSASDYLGSFGPAPVPSGAFAAAPQVAASPCRAAVYILASVFGGPNTTFNGNEVQEFDTHAAPTPCAVPVVSVLGGFKHLYTLRPAKLADPCIPCAELLASGAFVPAGRVAVASAEATASKRRMRAGVLLRFKSSAAADITFLFSRIRGKGHKPRRLGGFVYPAQTGQNALRFSGVLRLGHPLRPGRYRVSVSGGAAKRYFRLVVVRGR